MKRWSRYSLLLVVVALSAGIIIGSGLSGAKAIGEDDRYVSQQDRREQSRLIQDYGGIMYSVLQRVSNAYYREVDVADVAIAGLKGMMNQLDPYSDFFVEEQDDGIVADLDITTTGTYFGIGATIARLGGVLQIVAPMKGSPALRAGLQSGDVIAGIDGTLSRTFDAAKAASMIKGPEGTQVTLMIEREGIPDPLEMEITRAEIKVNDVSAASFAAPGIVYIEIGRFSRNTGDFLVDALEELEKEQKIEGLILDLRGNPGGLLDEAVAVAEPFFPPGEKIVYMRGRMNDMNQDFLSQKRQEFDGRLAVLVNLGSASASEIIAGAVQDLDRGVIVGRTTFGKGLVQSVGSLRGGRGENRFRLTTGEYFTPSGRNLQRPFIEDATGRLTIGRSSSSDTTGHTTYRSRNGRPVTGGGGVVPDIEADGILGNILLFDLKFRRTMFLRYVNNYVNTRGIEEGDKVRVDDSLLDDFQSWVEGEGFTFLTPTEMRLEDLKETARAENISDDLEGEIEALERAVEQQKNNMWIKSRDKIALELRREFVTKLEGYDAGLLEYMKKDPQFQAALDMLNDPRSYRDMLSGNGSGVAP